MCGCVSRIAGAEKAITNSSAVEDYSQQRLPQSPQLEIGLISVHTNYALGC
jgi:hypothetical protein